MRPDVITVNPELHVERAWELMERQRVHHLPVVKNTQLVGIVT
jgi:CBS domain-containing protein